MFRLVAGAPTPWSLRKSPASSPHGSKRRFLVARHPCDGLDAARLPAMPARLISRRDGVRIALTFDARIAAQIQRKRLMMTRVFTLMIGLLVATAAHAMRGDEFAQLLDAWNRANTSKTATREDELSASAFTGYVRGVEDSMNRSEERR